MARSIPMAAAAVALLLYLLTAGGGSYWLDAGELVAASVWLDIAHPPGHPLALLYGKLWSFVPLGPLPFRLALGQAVAAAAAAGFAAAACVRTLRAAGLHTPRLLAPLALFGALLPALSYGVWFQAVRPEVYALQLALLCAALWALCLVHAARAGGGGALSPLLIAALCVGFGLANHHLMAFFAFPTLLHAAFAVARVRGPRVIASCAGVGLLALATYAYLPARAGPSLPHNLGQPDNAERMYWVVSARVYARDMGTAYPQPLSERFADTLVVLVEQYHVIFLLMAAWGLYALCRRPSTRPFGWLWGLAALAVFGIRPWIGPVRSNPDSLGYLGAGFVALGVLAAAFVGSSIGVWPRRRGFVRALPGALWLLALGVVALQVHANYRRCDLSDFAAADLFDELRHRSLPPRAVVVATTPQTVFRYWEGAAVEALRDDVLVVPLPFLGYPGVPEALARRHPELRRLLSRHAATGELEAAPLRALARRRPLLIELDAHVPSAWFAELAPAGMLYRLGDAGGAGRALEYGARAQQRMHARLAAALGPAGLRGETVSHLLWLHFMDALYYASHGRIALARAAAERARGLRPEEQRLRALSQTLAAAREGRALDVSPFLRFD